MSNVQKKKLKDEFGEQKWETANGTIMKLKYMDIQHLRNTINYIQRKTRSRLELSMNSERSLKMQLATLMSTKDDLVLIKSPGLDLVDEVIKNLKEKLNSDFTIPQTAIDKELSDDFIYQCMIRELDKRNQAFMKTTEAPEDTFLEPKMDVMVMNIKENPEGIPMVVEVSAKTNTTKKVQVGDYLHNSTSDNLRITYITKRTITDNKNATMEITLNARTKIEKESVMKQITIGGNLKLY